MEEGGLFAECFGAEEVCADDVVRDVTAGAALHEAKADSERDGDQKQHRNADQRVQNGHNGPA